MIDENSALWAELPPKEQNEVYRCCLDAAGQLAEVQAQELRTASLKVDLMKIQIGTLKRKAADYQRQLAEVDGFLSDTSRRRQEETAIKNRLVNVLSLLAKPLTESDEAWDALMNPHTKSTDASLCANNKIDAIKTVRRCILSIGLMTAKNICDHRQAILAERDGTARLARYAESIGDDETVRLADVPALFDELDGIERGEQ